MLNPSETYSRKKNILYDAQGIKILKFLTDTVDRENISGDLVVNLNDYIKTFPERVEIVNTESSETQLTLF